jgi:prepilin-type N-terminal cleavage/methylation domain-containing protein
MSARRPVTGFTITELMVVIAVLGVMLAIAIPAYSGSRERSASGACAKNRQLFDQAKQLWMIDQGKVSANEVLFKDLLPEYIAEPPVCPTKGQYALNGLGAETTCSVHSH